MNCVISIAQNQGNDLHSGWKVVWEIFIKLSNSKIKKINEESFQKISQMLEINS